MRIIILFLTLVAVSAFPKDNDRIVGGSVTNIDQYPEMASLMRFNRHSCGGAIITVRSLLTAAHCVQTDPSNIWRARLGSSYHNRGGMVYDASSFIVHPQYNRVILDNDIAIVRVRGPIVFNPLIRPGIFAGHDYEIFDSDLLGAIGWGQTASVGPLSERLREVDLPYVNLDVCRQRFANVNNVVITDNMLCAGWLDVGGRDQCLGDSGGPVYHRLRSVIVGIGSFGGGFDCADPRFPGVNVRIMNYSSWLINNL